MLRQSFCHFPRCGPRTERRLWEQGIISWDHCRSEADPAMRRRFGELVEDSCRQLDAGNARYFASAMPADQQWRLFREFRHATAYLDIETTGLGGPGDHITTIALYDGVTARHYIHGQNLDQFARDVADYRLIVTYNGKCFDVPYIRATLGIEMNHAHIDLRYVLKSLGYSGGLKGCEMQLGLDRGALAGVDGYFAVLLWQAYQQRGDAKALQTLLAYNIQDVLTLETLMTIAYNRKLRDTPFADELLLPDKPPAANPFEADGPTVERVRAMMLSQSMPWT